MKFQTCTAILSRFVLASSISMFAVLPVAQADEAQVPVVSKKKLAPGETKSLNPQPIPPGKTGSAAKASEKGADKKIIFVGGKKAPTATSKARAGELRRSQGAPVSSCPGGCSKSGAIRHDASNIQPGEKK
jgi:hypothetical protein